MRKFLFPLCLFLLILGWVLLWARPVEAQLLITEIMPDPAAAQDTSEWIEIYNYTPFDIPLEQITVNDKSLISEQEVLPANEFLVITKNSTSFQSEFGNVAILASATISLTNSGGTVYLSVNGVPLDGFTYPTASAGKSWQRFGPLCIPTQWTAPTPNSPGSILENPECWLEPLLDQPTTVEITMDEDGVRQILSLGTENIFGWQKQEQFTLGDKIKDFILGETIHLYEYRNHELTHYTASDVWSLPKLQVITLLDNQYRLYYFQLTALGLEKEQRLSEFEIDVLTPVIVSNDFVFQPGPNMIQFENPIQLTCPMGSCVSTYFIRANGQGWQGGSFDVSHINQSSSTSSSASPSSASSSQGQLSNSLEFSEVFAAPPTGEPEWLELYNYGSTTIDLTGWYIQDNKGKHNLSGTIESGEYKVINNLKISLNNTGELLQLFNSQGIEVDNWEQPAVGGSITTVRLFGSTRHAATIYQSTDSSPGRENELTGIVTSSSSSKSSSTSSSKSSASGVLGTSTNYETILEEELTLPDLKIRDFSEPSFGQIPSTDVGWQILLLIGAAIAETALLLNMLWRRPRVRTAVKNSIKNFIDFIRRKLTGNNAANLSKEAKRPDNLQALRY